MKLVWEYINENIGHFDTNVAILKKDNGYKFKKPILTVRYSGRGGFFTSLYQDYVFLRAPYVTSFEAHSYVKANYPEISDDDEAYNTELLKYACTMIESNILEQFSQISKAIS